ncbi:hypothetical protein K493DRAFT_355798 [Basidiobolus meristosporus CBS 931.73]|uniref:Uncharacterized protein n=1 Tax=Basidiobolus meristosporus CBS 931.73 TaxID=1314790 RepID=A0A1Y1Y0L6_9FUNG|nr:hypothetical protein K493DRAFT_355798 [Basidiobolus meristosporus CBS 931.73]|eukprot:ORX91266.1 hypothetical protein K493DRAFT_355798 [Basidiobolus meristosporus CBS 931.73]
MLKYGYLIGETTAETRLVTPPHLKGKIGLTLGQSSRFCFVGTRSAILEWFRNFSDTIVEVNLGYDHEQKQDLVFDTFWQYNEAGTWLDSFWSYLGWPDKNTEHVRLEIRPRNQKIDDGLEPYHRVFTPNKVTLGAMAETLQKQWANPGPSFMDAAKHFLTDESTSAPYVDNLPLANIVVEDRPEPNASTPVAAPQSAIAQKGSEVPYLT